MFELDYLISNYYSNKHESHRKDNPAIFKVKELYEVYLTYNKIKLYTIDKENYFEICFSRNINQEKRTYETEILLLINESVIKFKEKTSIILIKMIFKNF